MGWQASAVLAFGMLRLEDWVWGQTGLHTEFQLSLDYKSRPYLKIQNTVILFAHFVGLGFYPSVLYMQGQTESQSQL